MSFFKHFGTQKLKQAKNAITQAIVEFDPETATEAAIEQMDEYVDQLSKELAKANQDLAKEKGEADAAKANYNKKLEVANKMQADLDGGELSGAQAKRVQASLDSLMEDLENTRDDVALEIEEADDAQETVDSIKEALESAVAKLKTARSDHKRARNEMKRAEKAEERAKRQEENAKRQAGITSGGSGMDTALDAMRSAAAERTANAEAAQTKADMLKPFDATSDDTISAYMDEVDGVDTNASSADKLAGLKGF